MQTEDKEGVYFTATEIFSKKLIELDRPIRLAIPNKGELYEPTIEALASCGVIIQKDRRLLQQIGKLSVAMMNVFDIPFAVETGAVAFGITSMDAWQESKKPSSNKVFKTDLITEKLGFGKCRLSVAVAAKSPTFSIERSEGNMRRYSDFCLTFNESERPIRVATKYPRITEEFFKDRVFARAYRRVGRDSSEGPYGVTLKLSILRLNGAVESSIGLGLADAIVDIVSSGKTLQANGLDEVATIFQSEAILISRENWWVK